MRNTKARETAWTGMLFALAIALSYLESLVSPLLGLMPAIKLGLSNVVVMYALLFLRTRTALLLVVLKALFAFLTRGATAGFLSLCGGSLSLVVMLVLLHLPISEYIFVPVLHWRITWPTGGGSSATFQRDGSGVRPRAVGGRPCGGRHQLFAFPCLIRCPACLCGEQRQGSPFKK